MSTPPGWFPDPQNEAFVRWWDGQQWTEHAQPTDSSAARTPDRAERRAERKDQRQQARAQKQQTKADQAAAWLDAYGGEVLSEMFSTKTITIYEYGFVQVRGLISGRMSREPEKLVSIEASSDVQKKSGLGRGAAAVVTGGWNLAGSNKRGDVYLTISTSESTYVLHEDPPTSGNLRTVRALQAAGESVIGRVSPAEYNELDEDDGAEALSLTSAPASGQLNVQERLRALTALHDDGLVTDEEYQAKRAQLIALL